MRRDFSGSSDEDLTIPATDCRELITGADFDGENATFHCLWIMIYNSHGVDAAIVDIYDQDEAAATAANQKFTVIAAAGTLTIVEIPEPGYLFYTNITAATTNGTVDAYEASAGGYLVGGQ